MQERLAGIAVLIPAWQPDEQLVELVRLLVRFPFRAIVVVNDGSEAYYDQIFAQVGAMPPAIVLRHERNRGQGRALKTAMRYVLETIPGLAGVVTADADGQHSVKDIVRVAEATAASGGMPVLGVRSFGEGVPLRSRFGNVVTRYVFCALSGYLIADTQCGLRGIPSRLIPAMLAVKGDRYEIMASMLTQLCWLGVPPLEVPIDTIYIDQNRCSHFRPIRDSIRIYLFLLRLYAARIAPMCFDLVGFVLAFAMMHHVGTAMLAGRIGAMAAVTLLECFAATRRRDVIYSLPKQIVMLACTGLVSYCAVRVLVGWKWSVIVAKLLVEAAIWLALAALPKRALSLKTEDGKRPD